jgi:hypothetical protein
MEGDSPPPHDRQVADVPADVQSSTWEDEDGGVPDLSAATTPAPQTWGGEDEDEEVLDPPHCMPRAAADIRIREIISGATEETWDSEGTGKPINVLSDIIVGGLIIPQGDTCDELARQEEGYTQGTGTYEIFVADELGKGSGGTVYLVQLRRYVTEGIEGSEPKVQRVSFALKIDKTNDEVSITGPAKKCPHILKSIFIGTLQTRESAFLMDLSDGDFSKHFNDHPTHRTDPHQVSLMGISILLGMQCMLRLGYLYTDMKDLNCLVKYKYRSEFPFVYIGDLGGHANAIFHVGDKVEYNSPSHKQWVPATVSEIHADGVLDIDVSDVRRRIKSSRVNDKGGVTSYKGFKCKVLADNGDDTCDINVLRTVGGPSLVRLGRGVATYPDPQTCGESPGFLRVDPEKYCQLGPGKFEDVDPGRSIRFPGTTISWSIGILLAQISGVNIDHLFYDRYVKRTRPEDEHEIKLGFKVTPEMAAAAGTLFPVNIRGFSNMVEDIMIPSNAKVGNYYSFPTSLTDDIAVANLKPEDEVPYPTKTHRQGPDRATIASTIRHCLRIRPEDRPMPHELCKYLINIFEFGRIRLDPKLAESIASSSPLEMKPSDVERALLNLTNPALWEIPGKAPAVAPAHAEPVPAPGFY